MKLKKLLRTTPLLDFDSTNIQSLVKERGWQALKTYDRIGAVYDYVRNEIKFGYNKDDAIAASKVLRDGYGQCNTKGILLMALFRAVGIPCRLHGFTIKKSLQRGVVPEAIYPITPNDIVHSWVEVFFDNNWVNLEGFILDADYLRALQLKFINTESVCTYGVGTDILSNPEVSWRGRDTYIQKTGINNDFGTYNDPDSFFANKSQSLSRSKEMFYRYIIRHWMNARVAKIRKAGSVP